MNGNAFTLIERLPEYVFFFFETNVKESSFYLKLPLLKFIRTDQRNKIFRLDS